MEINMESLIHNLKKAASDILRKDVSTLRGFERNQVKALGQHAKLIAVGIVSGDIDEDLRNFFIDGLESMALNFVRVLKGLLEVTIEKVWNAVVNVLIKAIETAIGGGL